MVDIKESRHSRRRYTSSERDEILRDAAALGQRASATKHGIPPTTISTWKSRGLWHGPADAVAGDGDKAVEPVEPNRRRSVTTAAMAGRRRYTDAEKQEIIDDAARLGVCGAADKHHAPKSTVSQWCKAARARAGDGHCGAQTSATATVTTEAATQTTMTAAPTTVAKGRIAKSYTPSQKAEALEEAAKSGVTATSDKLGMSRFSIYEWRR